MESTSTPAAGLMECNWFRISGFVLHNCIRGHDPENAADSCVDSTERLFCGRRICFAQHPPDTHRRAGAARPVERPPDASITGRRGHPLFRHTARHHRGEPADGMVGGIHYRRRDRGGAGRTSSSVPFAGGRALGRGGWRLPGSHHHADGAG